MTFVEDSLGFTYLKYDALMSRHFQTRKSCLDALQTVLRTTSLERRMSKTLLAAPIEELCICED